MPSLRIGLIGDFDEGKPAHRAIPVALRMAAEQQGCVVQVEWLATDATAAKRAHFDGMWCVPGSPYRDMDGALGAIRKARERRLPFLGTCGGFQHAVIEVARNVLGMADADHAESAPDARTAVVAALACSLVDASDTVSLSPGSLIAAAYDAESTIEAYHCRFGINPAYAQRLLSGPLRATAHDAQGDVRAVELEGHPFFVCTLFQPERAGLRGSLPPLVAAFVRAAARRWS